MQSGPAVEKPSYPLVNLKIQSKFSNSLFMNLDFFFTNLVWINKSFFL
jgi:hypothetical protein